MSDDLLTREEIFLLEEYKILIDLMKFHSDCMMTFNKSFITLNAIILGSMAFCLNSTNCIIPKTYSIIFLFFGIISSVIWICIGQRANMSLVLRAFQARDVERSLKRTNGVFSSGKILFDTFRLNSCDEKEKLDFSKGFFNKFGKISMIKTIKISPIFFILIYLTIIVYILFN